MSPILWGNNYFDSCTGFTNFPSSCVGFIDCKGSLGTMSQPMFMTIKLSLYPRDTHPASYHPHYLSVTLPLCHPKLLEWTDSFYCHHHPSLLKLALGATWPGPQASAEAASLLGTRVTPILWPTAARNHFFPFFVSFFLSWFSNLQKCWWSRKYIMLCLFLSLWI